MFAQPNFIAQLTAALLFFSLNCKANAEIHTQRNISDTTMVRTNEFENHNDLLENCISNYLEIFSNTDHSDLIAIHHSFNQSMRFIMGDLVGRIFQHDIMIAKHFSISQIEDGHFGLTMVFLDSIEPLIKWLSNPTISRVLQNYRKCFFVILVVPDHSTIAPFNEMQKLFQLYYWYLSIDINIMVATSKKVNIYTFYPYTCGHCGSTRPVLLDSCSEKTGFNFRRTNLFPIKNLNMNLCPFEVLAAHLPPFLIINNPFMGEESLTGIDGEILKVISRKLNFSIALSDRSNDIGGTVYDNGTSTGVYNLLEQRQANLTLGYSECTPNRMRFLSSTKSCYQTSLRIILKDSEGYSSLETVFFPFSTQTWIIVLIVNILRIICLILKRYRYHNRLHKAVPNMLYITWCFLTLIFCASYSSFFFTFMFNKPSKPLPRSFEELREQHYKILTDVIHGTISQSIPELNGLLVIVNSTPYQALKDFEESPSNRLGVLTNMETFSYFVKNESKNLDKYVNLGETLLDSMFCMYFPYFSHSTDEFIEGVVQLNSFGLLTQIARKFISSINLPNTRDYRTHQDNEAGSREILSLYHLKGPFIIFFGCQAIAGIVFILEVLSLKLKVIRRVFLTFTK